MTQNLVEIYLHSEKEAIPFYTIYPHSPGAIKPNLYVGKISKKLWEDFVDQFNLTQELYKKIKLNLDIKEGTLKL